MASKTNSATPDQMERVGDDSHTPHLALGLSQLREQGTFCDITIILGNQQFQAHKAVLSASSSYFMSMFTSGFQESKRSEVIIDGSPESFTQLLECAYTGYFHLSPANVCGVFRMACYMDFTHAIKVCVDYLMKVHQVIDLEDVFEMHSLAESHKDMTELVERLRLRLLSNFKAVVETKYFLHHASKEFIVTCLSAEEIETETSQEEEILQSTLNWLRYDWHQRKMHTTDLLKKIRLGLVPPDRLKQILGDEILAIPECKEMIEEVAKVYATKESARIPLNQSHPDMFATRNTITAPVSLKRDFIDDRDDCILFLHYRTKAGFYKLNCIPELPCTYPPFGFLQTAYVGYGFQTLVVGNQFYVAGGYKFELDVDGQPNPERHFLKYNFETNKWTVLPSMLGNHFVPELVELDGYIYAISTTTDRRSSDSVERFSIVNEEWEMVSPLINSLCNVRGLSCNGCIFVTGKDRYEDKCMMYKPTENMWIPAVIILKEKEVELPLFNIKWFAVYKNACYCLRRASYERYRKRQVQRVICNVESEVPSITLADPVDEDKIFGFDVMPFWPHPQFATFDKCKLGGSLCEEDHI
ncbi:kelch-like protein 15 isoform X3 [Amphiura filiformis]|uniref:kelch-like protein 15 isoform X3 n=1 Tax=Amphiura filiformis TaxID=82378 RepID=UPI003B223F46